jgi:Helix-turn-helix domain
VSGRSPKPLPLIWTQALRDSDLDATAVFVGLVVASFMNRHGEARPAVETIARGARCHTRTTQRALRRLAKKGWLPAHISGGRLANRYFADLPGTVSADYRSQWAETLARLPGFREAREGQPWRTERSTLAGGAPNPGTRATRRPVKASESAAPTAAAALSGSAASGPGEEKFAPEDDCQGCGERRTLVGPDFRYCGDCQDAIAAIREEGAT